MGADRGRVSGEAAERATVLVVCTANICRSPVVEAVLRDRLERRGLDSWTVRSAGTLARPGLAASRHGIDILRERGLDIADHQSHVVEASDVAASDLVLCMERFHAESLRAELPAYRQRIMLLTEMIGHDEDIADPYGGPRDWYEAMIDDVTEIIERGLDQIVAKATRTAAARVQPTAGE